MSQDPVGPTPPPQNPVTANQATSPFEVIGWSIRWARNWAVLLIVAIMLLKILGVLLGWQAELSTQEVARTSAKFAAQVGLFTFAALMPVLYFWRMSKVEVQDQELPVYDRIYFQKVGLWAAGAALVGISYVALWKVILFMLGWIESAALFPFVFIALPLLFALVFAWRLIGDSRPLQDRLFTWAGFGATFFGLLFLVLFFWQLGRETVEWFHYTPILVREQNDLTLQAREDLKRTENLLKDQKADLDRQYQEALALASTDQEKKEMKEAFEGPGGVFETSMADAKKTLGEKKQIADMPLRDTTPLALFTHFLTHGPSSQAQDAGIWTALLGSLLLAFLTIVLAVPIGVGAALYLEEYKHAGWLGRLIQININNLAGVPSVVFGILGGFVFVELIFKPIEHAQQEALAAFQAANGSGLGWWDQFLLFLPSISARNALGGGMTLALLTLPIIIVASQEAIRAVPISIRHGAYALGATHWQTIWQQVLPMARPGILTGTILALSRAIGEAAPLILFGALLFVDQDPGLFSRFTILPMQIFGWAERPAIPVGGEYVEMWKYNAAVASVILLVMLLVLNAVAIWLRNRAQKRMRY